MVSSAPYAGRYARDHPGRRRRRAPVSAHQGTRQAGRLLRRPLPHHRLHAQSTASTPASAASSSPRSTSRSRSIAPHPHGLEGVRRGARRVHRDPAAAEARRRALVLSAPPTRSIRTSTRSRARTRSTSSCCPATTSTRWTTRRCCAPISERGAAATIACLEVPVADATRFGIVADRHRRHASPASRRSRAIRRRCPARPTSRWRRWASTSSRPTRSISALEADAARDTNHDFGKDILPALIHDAPVFAYRFHDENKKAAKYWRDIGTLDAYYEANMDLCHVNPEFNLYDPEWPMRTWQPQAPPAKFVFADEGQRCGQALDSIISAGCIVSGSRVSRQHPLPERARAQLLRRSRTAS